MKNFIFRFSKKELLELVKDKKSLNEIIRKMGLKISGNNTSLLKKKLLIEGINFKPLKNNPNLKHNIFNVIDSKEKAYWLGFIAADGYVRGNRNTLVLDLGIKDEIVIDKFIEFIGADKTSKRIRKTKTSKGKARIDISSKEIVKDLIKLGLESPKTFKNVFIDFNNKELDLSFLMGYYDGDGYEGVPQICSGTKEVLKSFKKKYKVKAKIFKKQDTLYSLYIGQELYKEMINNYTDSLERKRRVYSHKGRYNNCNCGQNKTIEANCCVKCFKLKMR